MEKELQKEIINYLREQGYYCYSINPPNYKHCTFGTIYHLPDIHIVDINTYVELKDKSYIKAHKERQEKQQKVRDKLIEHGAKAFLVTSLEELKEKLKEVENGKANAEAMG